MTIRQARRADRRNDESDACDAMRHDHGYHSQCDHGESALMQAVHKGHMRVAHELLRFKASPLMVANDGECPFTLALTRPKALTTLTVMLDSMVHEVDRDMIWVSTMTQAGAPPPLC